MVDRWRQVRHAGEQVRRDGDESLGRQLVGDRSDPVGQPVDFVDDDHDRRLLLALGMDDPGVDVVAIDGDVDPLAVPGGLGQGGLGVGCGWGQRLLRPRRLPSPFYSALPIKLFASLSFSPVCLIYSALIACHYLPMTI